MDDDSDDGKLPGQSFFRNRNNEEKIEQYNENIENNNYDENYENQYPQNNDNYEYENDNYNNNINNYDYNDDYQENLDNENYIKNENSSYYNSNYYEIDDDGNYKNYNHNYYNYKNNNKNYKYKYNNNYYYKKYNFTKSKENFQATFSTYFKLWLMLVIKLESDKEKEITISKNEKINQEIIDSFLKNYDIELNHKNEKENKKINLFFYIKDIKTKHSVEKNYTVEFSIIIEDKIELFFVNKYIEIFVSGDIYFDKFPVFQFKVIDYKLTLDYKNNKNNKNNDNNIYKLPEEDKQFEIGMCPEYSINENKEFRELYININGEGKIKDPQREIRDSLDNLISEFLKSSDNLKK